MEPEFSRELERSPLEGRAAHGGCEKVLCYGKSWTVGYLDLKIPESQRKLICTSVSSGNVSEMLNGNRLGSERVQFLEAGSGGTSNYVWAWKDSI